MTLTNDDLAVLIPALLTWRFTNHRLSHSNIVPIDESVNRGERALRLAKKLGIGRAYLDAALATPAVSVMVKELEPWDPKPKAPKRKRRKSAPLRY